MGSDFVTEEKANPGSGVRVRHPAPGPRPLPLDGHGISAKLAASYHCHLFRRAVARGATMTPKKLDNLIAVKTKLAEKYAHLASVCKSIPRTESWMRLSKKHRAQAENLQREKAQGR